VERILMLSKMHGTTTKIKKKHIKMFTIFPNLTTNTIYYTGYILYHVYKHMYTVHNPMNDSCWEHLVQHQIKS